MKLQCASCLEPTVAGVHHDCSEVIAALRAEVEHWKLEWRIQAETALKRLERIRQLEGEVGGMTEEKWKCTGCDKVFTDWGAALVHHNQITGHNIASVATAHEQLTEQLKWFMDNSAAVSKECAALRARVAVLRGAVDWALNEGCAIAQNKGWDAYEAELRRKAKEW